MNLDLFYLTDQNHFIVNEIVQEYPLFKSEIQNDRVTKLDSESSSTMTNKYARKVLSLYFL